MAQKKDRSRFSIKFRENDPAHERTICILESQGQRNIAPFLVNAVLHYVQCSETPDISCMLIERSRDSSISREMIENVVKEILKQQGIIKEKIETELSEELLLVEKNKQTEMPAKSTYSPNMINEDMREVINRTLSSFRNR